MSRKFSGVAAIAAVGLISVAVVGTGSAAQQQPEGLAFTACDISGKQKSMGA